MKIPLVFAIICLLKVQAQLRTENLGDVVAKDRAMAGVEPLLANNNNQLQQQTAKVGGAKTAQGTEFQQMNQNIESAEQRQAAQSAFKVENAMGRDNQQQQKADQLENSFGARQTKLEQNNEGDRTAQDQHQRQVGVKQAGQQAVQQSRAELLEQQLNNEGARTAQDQHQRQVGVKQAGHQAVQQPRAELRQLEQQQQSKIGIEGDVVQHADQQRHAVSVQAHSGSPVYGQQQKKVEVGQQAHLGGTKKDAMVGNVEKPAVFGAEQKMNNELQRPAYYNDQFGTAMRIVSRVFGNVYQQRQQHMYNLQPYQNQFHQRQAHLLEGVNVDQQQYEKGHKIGQPINGDVHSLRNKNIDVNKFEQETNAFRGEDQQQKLGQDSRTLQAGQQQKLGQDSRTFQAGQQQKLEQDSRTSQAENEQKLGQDSRTFQPGQQQKMGQDSRTLQAGQQQKLGQDSRTFQAGQQQKLEQDSRTSQAENEQKLEQDSRDFQAGQQQRAHEEVQEVRQQEPSLALERARLEQLRIKERARVAKLEAERQVRLAEIRARERQAKLEAEMRVRNAENRARQARLEAEARANQAILEAKVRQAERRARIGHDGGEATKELNKEQQSNIEQPLTNSHQQQRGNVAQPIVAVPNVGQ